MVQKDEGSPQILLSVVMAIEVHIINKFQLCITSITIREIQSCDKHTDGLRETK